MIYYGYCIYKVGLKQPVIYNLFVKPEYRRNGNARNLIGLVKKEIRRFGYTGKILIEAKPRDNSIGLSDLIKFYKTEGLTVINESVDK